MIYILCEAFMQNFIAIDVPSNNKFMHVVIKNYYAMALEFAIYHASHAYHSGCMCILLVYNSMHRDYMSYTILLSMPVKLHESGLRLTFNV